MTRRFLDFFAGVGMAEIGLAPDWACVWANDIDPKKARTYCLNHDPARFRLDDIANVHGAELPGPIDLAWASFPCQDLSLAGWRRGMSPGGRSGTFWEFHRIMRELRDDGRRPPLIVLENVVGLLSSPDFPALCDALTDLGMRFGALVIDAVRFLPQSRPRVFVVAVDDAFAGDSCAVSEPGASPWFPPNLRRAWAGLSPTQQERWVWWNLPVPPDRNRTIEDLIEERPAGVAWHTAEQTERNLDLMSPINRAKVDDVRSLLGRHVGFLYKRTRNGQQRAEVRFDGVSGCLRTATGGSSRQTVVVVDGGDVRTRLLSPREAARLMGLDDDFALPPAYNDAYHAMGDGVVVDVVRWLGSQLLLPISSSFESQQEPSAADGRIRLGHDLQLRLMDEERTYDLVAD